MLASRLQVHVCVCLRILERMSTQQGFGYPDIISYPNTQTFFQSQE